MLEYTSGDILNDRSEALINTVNCVGVMGRGIALQFKKAWPENFKAYAAACKREEVQPGRMLVFDTKRLTPPRYIINFPTKRHWKGKSRIEDIESGLAALVKVVRDLGIQSIALPPLGSGLGGLPWAEVRAMIERTLADLPDVRVIVYEPKGAPSPESMRHVRDAPPMTEGRAALIGLIRRYLRGLLDPSVSLIEVHKLMYFMQEAGEPLRLKYVKGPYGPYAENLRHVLHAIEGHYVFGYADGGDAPDKPLSLVPGAVDEADSFLKQHAGTLGRFERVATLVDGFESPFGLELLGTVHWVLTREAESSNIDDVLSRTYSWNDRKKQFSARQIGIAVTGLNTKGWTAPSPDEASK